MLKEKVEDFKNATKYETINTIETDPKLLTPDPLPPKAIKNSKRASFI